MATSVLDERFYQTSRAARRAVEADGDRGYCAEYTGPRQNVSRLIGHSRLREDSFPTSRTIRPAFAGRDPVGLSGRDGADISRIERTHVIAARVRSHRRQTSEQVEQVAAHELWISRTALRR